MDGILEVIETSSALLVATEASDAESLRDLGPLRLDFLVAEAPVIAKTPDDVLYSTLGLASNINPAMCRGCGKRAAVYRY